jgi:hypothetical protein
MPKHSGCHSYYYFGMNAAIEGRAPLFGVFTMAVNLLKKL